MATMSETSYWLNFFTKAGIPAGDSAHYAVMFTDNRITREMLLDLSKEYLTDMGITRLGDVIAILKHAKDVYKQEAKDKLLMPSFTSLSSPSSLSLTPMSRRSTAASRMVNHFTSKHPEAAPMSQSPSPKPLPPEPSKSKRKVSVFERLGTDNNDETVTITSGKKLAATQSLSPGSVFSRLGGKSGLKRTASAASLEDLAQPSDAREESLPYAGVLKNPGASSVKKPNVKVSLNRSSLREPLKIKKTIKTTEDRKTAYIQRPEVSTTTEGVLSDFAKKEAPSLKERLGSKADSSTVTSSSRLASPAKKHKLTVQDRLGVKREELQSSPVVSSTQNVPTKVKKLKAVTLATSVSTVKSSGVFSRLGKKSQT
ncbi:hypothetical protein Bpfe_012141 [Biomphalaria pfeifferi]|uniref:SAM domain-containing protein n=1 Tax=Biomphalaria pfeifferi TaxID=112525 RepID=A0AAD8BPL8_BIOPF|nr:hypothetical protein Bpfe_012141 [Biomphalaria pfeifferi]